MPRDRRHFRADGKPKEQLTQSEAERRATAQPPDMIMDAYHCPVCDAWHIGTARSATVQPDRRGAPRTPAGKTTRRKR